MGSRLGFSQWPGFSSIRPLRIIKSPYYEMYLGRTVQDYVLARTDLLIVQKKTRNRSSVITKQQPDLNSDLKLNHILKIDHALEMLPF